MALDRLTIGRGPAGAVAIAVCALLYLVPLGFDAPVHLDTARDLLLARDCVDAGRCHFAGPPASIGGLWQGALWIHVLEAARALHLRAAAVEGVTWLLCAGSAAVFYRMARRTFTPRTAGVAAGLYVVLAQWIVQYPILWSPSVAPLPVALFYFFLLRYHDGGERLPLALAAGSLALSMDSHVACSVLLAPAALVVARRSQRPRGDFACLATVIVAVLACDSYRAWSHNLSALGRGNAAWLALLGALATLATWLASRRWPIAGAQGRPSDGPPWTLLLASCLVPLLFAMLVGGTGLALRYFTPALPPVAMATTWALSRAGLSKRPACEQRERFVLSVLALVAAAAVTHLAGSTFFGCPEVPMWTLRDAERIAERLSAEGWTATPDGLYAGAAYSQTLTSTLDALLPSDLERGTGRRRPVAVLKLPQARRMEWNAYDGWETLDLDDRYIAALNPDHPALRFDEIRCCVKTQGSSEEACVGAAPSRRDPGGPHVAAFAYPSMCAREPPRPAATIERRYLIPIAEPPEDRHFEVVSAVPSFFETPWQLALVAGPSPAVVVWREQEGDSLEAWPPGVVELPRGLTALRPSIVRPRCTLCARLEDWLARVSAPRSQD